MAITHDYVNTSGYKPTVAEASIGELIPNLADGTLWTKDTRGAVIQVAAVDDIYLKNNADDTTSGIITSAGLNIGSALTL